MKVFNKAKGYIGEERAVKFLKKKKYQIIAINYVNKVGEIDIIARDGEAIVFVEVKARETKEFGLPCEAVDARKQNKIRRVAELFLLQNKLYDRVPVRFDVIEVLGDEINHIVSAF